MARPSPTLSPCPRKPGVRFSAIPGAPLHYLVGSDGSVWSHLTVRGHAAASWRELTLCDLGKGYLYVGLGRAYGLVAVHRLVLLTFRGKPPSSRHVSRHLNGVRSDNRLRNLRWSTQAENLADRDTHGTNIRGVRNGSAKLTKSLVKHYRALRAQGILNVEKEAEAVGVSKETIRRAVRKETWTHV